MRREFWRLGFGQHIKKILDLLGGYATQGLNLFGILIYFSIVIPNSLMRGQQRRPQRRCNVNRRMKTKEGEGLQCTKFKEVVFGVWRVVIPIRLRKWWNNHLLRSSILSEKLGIDWARWVISPCSQSASEFQWNRKLWPRTVSPLFLRCQQWGHPIKHMGYCVGQIFNMWSVWPSEKGGWCYQTQTGESELVMK